MGKTLTFILLMVCFMATVSYAGNLSNLENITHDALLNISNCVALLETNNTVAQTCDYDFEIITQGDVFEDKIKFKFSPDLDNFSIDYWIEDFNGEVVKSLTTTTNLNEKSFTPKAQTAIYYIKARLKTASCEFLYEKQVYFHAKEEIENKDPDSKIEILNKDTFESQNYIEYEVYRGDTQKRTIFFYKDNERFNSFTLDKYESQNGKIYLSSLGSFREFRIDGLGEKDSILIVDEVEGELIEENITVEIEAPKPTKQYFNITSLEVKNSILSFKIDSNIENLEYICYVLHLRTKLTEETSEETDKDKA